MIICHFNADIVKFWLIQTHLKLFLGETGGNKILWGNAHMPHPLPPWRRYWFSNFEQNFIEKFFWERFLFVCLLGCLLGCLYVCLFVFYQIFVT